MLDEAVLTRVRSLMHVARVPSHTDKVYKEECMLSFDTPESPGGLYISLSTFQGFGEDFVQLDHAKTGCGLYLLDKWTPSTTYTSEEPTGPTLGTGTDGGLQLALGGPRPRPVDKSQSLVVFGEGGARTEVPLPCLELPERVQQSMAAILTHSALTVDEAASVWEEERRVSRYAADLPQLPSEGKTISPNPKEWKCDETGVTENLWLNLSTGFIGSGRANFDGSGGTGSAMRHFEATGRKYPLAVKLGTITPQGADVHSYAADEMDMVLDPQLHEHLAHWGINMMQMEKTAKTLAELQMELNKSYEYSRIMESGGVLRPVSGPGLTGLINLGNSCYMNSVLQVLWLLPDVCQRYVGREGELFTLLVTDAPNDLALQLAKVGTALVRGRTGHPPPPTPMEEDGAHGEAAGGADDAQVQATAVRPQAFKSLVGRGHPEFTSARQQDALEYFGHLLELVSRCEHAQAERLGVVAGAVGVGAGAPTRSLFAFKLEDRLQCLGSGAVRYSHHEETWLALDIPLQAATNKEQVEAFQEREAKRAQLRAEDAAAYIGANGGGGGVVSSAESEDRVVPKVPFAACLATWAGEEEVADVWSGAAGRRGPASKRTRLTSFPPFLVIALKRYYTADNWVPKKLEVEVEVPLHLDLTGLRGSGPQGSEVLQPEDEGQPAPPTAQQPQQPAGPDPAVVLALADMGFSAPACHKAAMAVGPGGGAEEAMGWLITRLEEPGINDPLPPTGAPEAAPTPAGGAPSVETLSLLTGMGFDDRQATAALKACANSVERAADWLFSHMDDLTAAVAEVEAAGAATTAPASAGGRTHVYADGPGVYELVGIVSHMGANTSCGHYVAHTKKEGKWYIFNDEKVAESEAPPLALGYMYLYQQTTPASTQ